MIVDEAFLTRFRNPDGLCDLRPLDPKGWRFADYPNYAEWSREARQRINLMDNVDLNPDFTQDVFLEKAAAGSKTIAVFAFLSQIPVLPTTRTWRTLQHQAAGYICRQILMIATELRPLPEIDQAFSIIAQENYHSCGGRFEGPETDQLVTRRYLSRITELGLTCSDVAQRHLCESVYPIDANTSTLSRISDDLGDLASLLEYEAAAPVLLFLSENSD